MAEGEEGTVEVSIAGPPANGKAWSKLTATKVSRSKFQASDILTRLQRLDFEEQAQKGAALEQEKRERERVKNDAKKRIKKHQVIITDSQSCILAIEEAMQRLADVLSRTRHERYTRFANSQVNDRRCEYRDKRPQAEAFRDQLQNNLSREKSTLANARKELQECEADVSKFLGELEKLRADLSFDAGSRRLKVEHETQLLKPKIEDPSKPSAATTEEPTEDPQTPAAVLDTTGPPKESASAANTHGAHPPLPDMPLDGAEARKHVTKTQAMLSNVENFITKSKDAIKRSQIEGFTCNEAVEKSLSKRTVELSSIKKDLEQNILTVRYSIEEGRKGIEKFNKRLDPKDTDKAAKIADAQKVLENLLRSEAALVDELRTKTAALNLDNSCRRLNSTAAAVKPKTMPNDKTAKLSASSPNLGLTGEPTNEAERTMSPAGGSSALKAGAAAVGLG